MCRYLYKQPFPNLEGGTASLVYFREIAKRTEAKFIEEFAKESTAGYVNDLLGQAWRNSVILKDKFDYLRLALIFLAVAIPTWVISLIIFALAASSAQTAAKP